MTENRIASSWTEWIKLILSGLFLGVLLGYNLYCIRCFSHGLPILYPINWCFYCVLYSTFHLAEFYLTSIFRPNELCYKSFLLNQSTHYVFVTLFGIIEFWIEYYFFPEYKSIKWISITGIVVTIFGIVLRALSEITMKENFSHVIQCEKTNSHRLVTTGVYSFFRHPSYTGWYYYLLGREILLHNCISFIMTAYLFWVILSYRIEYEEKSLCDMFPEYAMYKKHSHICIPFM